MKAKKSKSIILVINDENVGKLNILTRYRVRNSFFNYLLSSLSVDEFLDAFAKVYDDKYGGSEYILDHVRSLLLGKKVNKQKDEKKEETKAVKQKAVKQDEEEYEDEEVIEHESNDEFLGLL